MRYKASKCQIPSLIQANLALHGSKIETGQILFKLVSTSSSRKNLKKIKKNDSSYLRCFVYISNKAPKIKSYIVANCLYMRELTFDLLPGKQTFEIYQTILFFKFILYS